MEQATTITQFRSDDDLLERRLAVGAATAIIGFAIGVAAGTAGLGRSATGWHRRTGLIALVELALLAAMVAGWLATDGKAATGASRCLLAVAGAAMRRQTHEHARTTGAPVKTSRR